MSSYDEVTEVRSALSDFYGMMLSDDQNTEETAQQQPVVNRDPRDLDSENFDADLYIGDLLAAHSMEKLIHHDNAMIDAKKALDSEMQNLVYDNYNKFISATDMIRKMKDNVESMEGEMNKLWKMMETISDSSTKIESKLSDNRVKVENLVVVNKLLKRLEFLFELPGRLSKSIELGAYEQAVKYYRLSSQILKQYKHIKSFTSIREESETIILQLKKQLKDAVKDKETNSETQLSYASMLIELDESPQSLLSDVLSSRKHRMKKDMQRCVELSNASYAQYEPSSNNKNDEKKSFDPENSNQGTGKNEPSELLALLQNNFIEPFIIFAATFVDTFIRPNTGSISGERDRANSATNASINKAKQESMEKCNAALIEFTTDLFNEYFTLARKELLKLSSLDILMGQSNSDGDNNGSDLLLLKKLTRSLAFFYKGLLSPLKLVPKARLGDRAAEIIEHSIRHAVESLFEKTQREIVIQLKELHVKIETFDAIAVAKALEQGKRKSTNDTTGGEGKDNNFENKEMKEAPSPSSSSTNDSHRRRASSSSPAALPRASAVALRIRQLIDSGIQLLIPLLNTKEYLPENLGLSFNSLAHGHFHQLLTAISNLLLCKVLRKSEGPVFDPLPPSPLSDLPAVSEQKFPFFFLFLSQVCLHLESKELPASSKLLKKSFPLSGSSQLIDAQMPSLMARIKETAQLLLARFVECYGMMMTAILRQYLTPLLQSNNSPTGISPAVPLIQKHIERLTAELSLIFPKSKDSAKLDRASTIANTRMATSNKGGRNVNRDIERLFAQKVSTFGAVKFDRVDALHAVQRIMLRAIVEIIRQTMFVSIEGLQQVQIDVFAYRRILNSSAEESRIISGLLDECINSANDRCKQASEAFDDDTVNTLFQKSSSSLQLDTAVEVDETHE